MDEDRAPVVEATSEAVAAAADTLRAGFASGMTRPLAFRREALERLRGWLRAHEDEVLEALQADLGKAPFEGYATELGMVYDEIKVQLAGMARWAAPKRVGTPLVHFHSTSRILVEPLGTVLIMSPWN